MGSQTKADLKREKFAVKFFECMNGREAGLYAGVKDGPGLDSQVSELLSHPKVLAKLAELKNKLEKKVDVNKERVISELALVGFADMKDYATIGEEGQVTLNSFDSMPDGASRAVQKVKERRSIRANNKGEGDESIIDIQLEYGHHDKIAALREISDLMGYYPAKKMELSGSITVNHAERLQNAKKLKEAALAKMKTKTNA